VSDSVSDQAEMHTDTICDAVAVAVVFGVAKRGEVTMLLLCLDLQRGRGLDAVATTVMFELAKRGKL
jgi:hypothetical protein